MREVSRGKLGHISIACPEGVAAHVLAPTLARFVKQNPDVAVSVHDGDATSVERLMHSMGTDFGITGYWKEHSDFLVEPLTVDRCCVICPSDHPFARRKSLSIRDLDNVPIVALNRDAGTRRLVESICATSGVRLVVQFEVARVSTVVEMVRSKLCISVLTALSTPNDARSGLRVVPFREPELTYPINIVTPANRMMTASAQNFVSALRHQFAPGSDQH